MKRKAQSSMEFFTLVGLAFLMTILFVVVSANEVREFSDQKEFFLIKDLALKLQKEVTLAADAVEGYKRTFTLPDELESTVDYFIQIRNNTITINSSKTVISVAIVNVTGEFTKGSNTIEKKNSDGKIYVNT